MKSLQDSVSNRQVEFDRLFDAQLRAEHDGDIEAILAPMSDGIVHDIDGRGRWLSHRVLWPLEVQDVRIVRETVWNDLSGDPETASMS